MLILSIYLLLNFLKFLAHNFQTFQSGAAEISASVESLYRAADISGAQF
jgi:hypothetical protein